MCIGNELVVDAEAGAEREKEAHCGLPPLNGAWSVARVLPGSGGGRDLGGEPACNHIKDL